MNSLAQPVVRDLVLVGGGHSHVVLVRRFGMKPVPGVRLTLICRDTHTPYSGMLPGYVAGHYGYDDVHIDLRRLAESAGVRYLCDEVTGLDRERQQVECRARPPVDYDLLSINIGSTPQVGQVPGAAEHAVPVKPINQFNDRWLGLLERVRTQEGPIRIAVVGAGAGGVEMTLAMQYRLRGELQRLGRDPTMLTFELFSGSPQILPTHDARVRRSYEHILRERGVRLHLGEPVTAVMDRTLQTGSNRTHDADEVVWVTQAGGASWLRDTGLALDERGFIRVTQTLQTVSDRNVYAAGDIASIDGYPVEKAGVFAVRQGRPLADNLRSAVHGRPQRRYTPQRTWLALISTGDRYAVASRGRLSFQGAWVWRWKDWIDRRFMRRFSDLKPMSAPSAAPAADSIAAATATASMPSIATSGFSPAGDEAAQLSSAQGMRCGGCGAKVGALVLSRALGGLKPLRRDEVAIGLDEPDDAAVVRVPSGKAMVHTVDFFRAFIDDPFLFGKIAANHALGDLYAMGGEPQTATAIVTIPPGLEVKVEETLRQLMTGAVTVLDEAGCSLIGGHTGEGSELALGFAINGLVDDDLRSVTRKSGMQIGDALILTKPIGTGTLFAAHALLAARGRWIDSALASMLVSNRDGARLLRAHGVTACTDLTGFGLLGHLVEMTRPSGVSAVVELSALPVLAGAEETAGAGLLSSLHSANLKQQRDLNVHPAMLLQSRYRLLFDPQTAGGLLASVPAEQASACIGALRAAGYGAAAIIGRVIRQNGGLQHVLIEP